ncbi:hypothetical protein CYMTET_23501 [Cymbomonas tetramitiformis]|uniref:Uncharacterized protein n=1 Tax=Cymbomonas tetramitiformis TaxID=36881 RepID=A0AAE0FYD2_9CHLO|nr:hypothetical protein CYMTET_23501 [Cymbomonas tetramitiformis]
MRKELSAVRQEIKDLKGGRGQGQGEHDRRSFFEKKIVDARHDRGRGQRGNGKGKGKGAFYRVGAKSAVDSAFHNAFDDKDDDAFAELCDYYGKAEVHKGPTANTFASHDDTRSDGHSLRAQYSGLREISAVKFTVDPPLAARSVVFEDSKPADDPPRVAFTAEKTAKIIPTVKTTPTIVHNDERALGSFDKWANYVSPVLDMTPTVSAHFDNFTLTADPFDETEGEDACEDEDIDETAEVVSIPQSPAEEKAARLTAWHEHAEVPGRKRTDVYRVTDVIGGYSYLQDPHAYDAAVASYDPADQYRPVPLQPPPPRQRIGGGRKIGLLQTALLWTLFFCTFVFLTDECDATVVAAQFAQPLHHEIDFDTATPPAQGLVVSQHGIVAFDAATEDFYEDPGPDRSEIETNKNFEYGRAWCDYAEGSLTVVTTWDNVLPAIVYVSPSPVQSDDEEEEHQ